MAALFASWDTLLFSVMLGLWIWESFHLHIKLKIEMFFCLQIFL